MEVVHQTCNSFDASGDFGHLLITFANNLDPDLLFVDFIKSYLESPGIDLIQFRTSSGHWNDLQSYFLHHLFK